MGLAAGSTEVAVATDASRVVGSESGTALTCVLGICTSNICALASPGACPVPIASASLAACPAGASPSSLRTASTAPRTAASVVRARRPNARLIESAEISYVAIVSSFISRIPAPRRRQAAGSSISTAEPHRPRRALILIRAPEQPAERRRVADKQAEHPTHERRDDHGDERRRHRVEEPVRDGLVRARV